jgi:23S rRNA (guanine745-N1)-methyltransferase
MRCALNTDIFICPVCRSPLLSDGKTYKCEKNHSFDISREGYVNLLRSSRAGVHGDNKEMIAARCRFLSSGHYSFMCDELAFTASEHFCGGGLFIDCGCGECYYTERVSKALLSRYPDARCCGIDVSRDALKRGAKRKGELSLCVSSVYDMPFGDGCADLLISVFSPFAREEFLRVLKKGGTLISVIPDKKHLWSLKAALYETPYENTLDEYEIDGFEFLGKKEVKNELHLKKEEIADLFMMTPYYYRTRAEDKKKILDREQMTIEAEFQILVYKKK